MGHVIEMPRSPEGPPDNLIIAGPLEFRRIEMHTSCFIQMRRAQSEELERHRAEVFRGGGRTLTHLPAHFALRGGLASSVQALYAHRKNEAELYRLYYLLGLADCMVNQVNPVLRTDILRSMYKKVFSMKRELNIQWHGPMDQILLPIDCSLFNEQHYRSSLKTAGTLKELYSTIREGTTAMFHTLSRHYVFYCPATRAQQ